MANTTMVARPAGPGAGPVVVMAGRSTRHLHVCACGTWWYCTQPIDQCPVTAQCAACDELEQAEYLQQAHEADGGAR